MTRLRFAVGAIALACSLLPAPASAQVRAKTYLDPSGHPQAAIGIFCVPAVDGTGCASGGGGGGGGDASAANQTSQITLEQSIRDEIGAISGTPTANTLQGRLEAMRVLLAAPVLASGAATSALQSSMITALGSPYQAGGALPLPSGAATSALQTTGNTSLATLSATVTTTGSTAPTTAQQISGVTPAGTTKALATGTLGGLLPGQGTPTSTRTALTASTITTIDIARTGRLALTVTVEAALTANLYLCAGGQSTTCSATVYDGLVPSGATAGSVYTFVFAPNTAIYAFSTGTPTVNTTSWIGQ